MAQSDPPAEPDDRYLWCELCGVANRQAAWVDAGNRCPNCGAGLVYARPWEEIRALNPHYPATPSAGQEYPLYG